MQFLLVAVVVRVVAHRTILIAPCFPSTSTATLDTVDFVMPDGTIAFRTSAEEKDRVFVQLVRSLDYHSFVSFLFGSPLCE